MSGVLLWLLSLAACLLLVCLTAGVTGGLRWGAAIARSVFAGVLLLGLAMTGIALVFRSRNWSPDWLLSSAGWTFSFAAGAVWLLRRAATWPRARLAVATLAASVTLVLVFEHVRAKSQQRLAVLAAAQRAIVASLQPEPVLDRENAALGYQEAIEQLDSLSGFPDWFGRCGAPCPSVAAKPEDVERLARASQPTLRLVRRAAAMTRYRSAEFDYANPVATRIPSLLAHRRCANLLAWDAVERARRGDSQTASADILSAWRMAHHLASGQSLIEHLIGVAIQGIGTDALEDSLAAGPAWRAEDLAALSAARPASLRPGLMRAFRLEESIMLLTLGGLDIDPVSVGPAANLGSPFTLVDAPVLGALYRAFVLPEDLRSYSEWLGKARDLLAQGKNARKEWNELTESFVSARKGPMADQALPSLLRAWLSTAGADARGRLAQLAVAVTAYQLKHKKYPAALEDLVPEFVEAVPVDPFNRKPLKMAPADGGVVLYSVGGDGKDDGGVESERRKGEDHGDVTFCIGPAYAARRAPRPAAAARR